jgi:hypothetical protein
MREKMAEERRKKLAMLDSKRKAQNAAEEMVMTENLDELGMKPWKSGINTYRATHAKPHSLSVRGVGTVCP